MNENCIECVTEPRTGGDLLCDKCRAAHGNTLRPVVVCPICRGHRFLAGHDIIINRKFTGMAAQDKCPHCHGHGTVQETHNAPRVGGGTPTTHQAVVGKGSL